MKLEIENLLEILAICAAILMHSAILAFWAGKILQQLQNVCARMDKWESTMDAGGFAHCQLHTQRLCALELEFEHLRNKTS